MNWQVDDEFPMQAEPRDVDLFIKLPKQKWLQLIIGGKTTLISRIHVSHRIWSLFNIEFINKL